MPSQSESWGARSAAGTAPTSRPETSPVYDRSPGYQPAVPPPYPSVIPQYVPPRKRAPLGWILAFIGMGLFTLVVVAVMFMARLANRRSFESGGSPPPPAARQNERQLDESSADTVFNTPGNETTLTKTFPLGEGVKFSIENNNGNITVTSWDEPKTELKVIKRGPSDRGGQVFFSNSGANFTIRAASSRGSSDVRIELKVPREVSRIRVSSNNGAIRLADVKGEILVEANNGSIDLLNVIGVSKVRTNNGAIKATLLEASDQPMEFESNNGSIDLTLPPDFEADLEANTVRGGINIDESFGIQVEKAGVGQRANGQMGLGGKRLRISTSNGTIKVGKAELRAKGSDRGKKNGN